MARSDSGKPSSGNTKTGNRFNIGYLFLVAGILVCSSSFDYQSKIMALIGTSIIFWGTLLIYFRPRNYVSTPLVETAIMQYYGFLNEMIPNIGKRGKPQYFAPPTISGLTITSLLLPVASNEMLETHENEINVTSEGALKIMPPGQKLSEAMEESGKVNYSSIDPLNLCVFLEKAVIEDLEVAKSLKIEYSSSIINVKARKNVYSRLYRSSEFRNLLDSIGDPLISAIACAFSRSTGASITLEGVDQDERNDIIDYRLKLQTCEEDS